MSLFETSHRNGKKRRSRHFFNLADDDPMSSVANLFDIAMMFAIASLILATFSTRQIFGAAPDAEYTILKNPGKADMEIIKKKGVRIEKYKMSKKEAGGEGERLGVCYRLANGEVVYIPEVPDAAGDKNGGMQAD